MARVRLTETVTYLEMTSPDELCPGRPADVTLEPNPGDALFRDVQARVGEAYHWPTTHWTPAQWDDWFAVPCLYNWLFRTGAGEPAGIVTARAHADGEVEIDAFGLLPECVGKGLGGHALTLAVRAAWSVPPRGADRVTRVWLHTSTLDSPAALANYQHRGFRIFRTQTGERMVPDPVSPPE
jgi:GNAT superfamily N-acetyltransferase